MSLNCTIKAQLNDKLHINCAAVVDQSFIRSQKHWVSDGYAPGTFSAYQYVESFMDGHS